ncbi:MAG: hypothetical protein NTZ03_02130 [Actinobacteria bacterium]|nr:hypothetical protein [Actinomycetota bacterium]
MPTDPSLLARIGAVLRGARTLSPTRFTAPRIWRPTPGSFAALIAGLWLFGTGEGLLLAANLGAAPWSVLAQGVSIRTGISIGWTTLFISTCVLLLWIPLRQRPGLGTIMNILVIALALGITYSALTSKGPPQSLLLQFVMVFGGIAIIGIGSGFYLTSGHGPGPRDGWMTGLHRVTGWPVGVVRLCIEVVVLGFGWLLGGTVGIGTLLFAVLIGQAVAMGLALMHRLFGVESPSPEHHAILGSEELSADHMPSVDDHDLGD